MCDDERPPCKGITTLYSYKTCFNADSVEWCPHVPNQNLFVCANYQLDESEGKRVGCILVFIVRNDLKFIQRLQTSAILDQKWCPNKINNRSILGVANAENSIELYSLNPESSQLEFLSSYKVNDESETLILSLDWSTGKYESSEPLLTCSDSKGHIYTFCLQNGLVLQSTAKGHDFEAWITAFYYWDPNIFFSGGDDCCFLKYDTRVGLEPLSRNRSHEAGVTSMHSNSEKEFLLATGSYDSLVRLWDIRNLKNCMHSVKTNGTLWRLKWDPHSKNYLLAACMRGGLHILSASETLAIVDSYYNHSDIVYGADWRHTNGNQILIASCSFYDNLLCISQVIGL